jgi:hypothetical protein
LLELKELYLAREALVKDRTAAKNRAKALTLALLKRHNAQRLEQIQRQIETVEAAITRIIEADADLAVSLRERPPSVEIGFGGEIALTSAPTSALKSCSWLIPFC